MRFWYPFLPLSNSWVDAPSYCNWNIPYISSNIYQNVYFSFLLCCPWIFCPYGLYRLAQTPFLRTASYFAKISWCNCQGGVVSGGGSWGIGCPHWWSNSASKLLDFHVGCRDDSQKCRKGSDLWRPHVQLSVMSPLVQKRFECIAPVNDTPGVPCIVGSR